MSEVPDILQVKDVCKRFGGLKALSNITFDLPAGQILGLIGPNGAGKTTLFNLITGLYLPSKRRIIFEGKDITGEKPYKIVQGGVARTFQNLRIFSSLTALDNIKVAKHFASKSSMVGSVLRLPGFMKEEISISSSGSAWKS